MPQRTVEHLPVCQILEDTVEVASLVPQERMHRINEQTVDVPMSQVSEDSEQVVDVLNCALKGRGGLKEGRCGSNRTIKNHLDTPAQDSNTVER